MTTFAELIDQVAHWAIGAEGELTEMRERVAKLQAAIDDPDGADELPMIVLEFLEGHL